MIIFSHISLAKAYLNTKSQKRMTVELLDNERELVKKLGIRVGRGARVLDMGCGTGRLGAYLREERGCDVLGIDTVREKLDKARQRAAGVEFAAQSAECMSLRSEIFDFVVSLKVLHEIARPAMALKEVFRVLKPWGRVLIIDWVRGSAVTKGHAHASRYFTPQRLEEMLSRTGFEDTVIEMNDAGELMLIESVKM